MYEAAEAGRRLLPLLPVMARIDGRAFHSFTRGMRRPYDADCAAAMVATTLQLVAETRACMGYTQSDEIWNDYPTHFKRGTYVQRRITTRGFSGTELQALPPLHAARTNPDLQVQRSEIVA